MHASICNQVLSLIQQVIVSFVWCTTFLTIKISLMDSLSLSLNQNKEMLSKWKKWGSQSKSDQIEATTSSPITISGILNILKESIDEADQRPVIALGDGDPSLFPSFRTTPLAEDAIIGAVRSAKFNCYAPTLGVPSTRRAIAEYLSRDLPYQLSSNDVYVTLGCKQAIEISVASLARPGANILLPKPGYPRYNAHATSNDLEIRHFDLLPENGWEVDLDSVEALADENTLAMVVINPGNSSGSVFTYQHLLKIALTARKLGVVVIADEVYGHLAFGTNPFVPMGLFSSIVPVITLGSISKRWLVPGWRLGWLVINDPIGILQESGIVKSIKSYTSMSQDPPTFIQGAVLEILEKTDKNFFSKINSILRENADICYDTIKEISCLSCPHKPEGSMFIMVKLDMSKLDDIVDDMGFCVKLAKEESVLIIPGAVVEKENWLRITYAVEPSYLKDGLERIKAFCKRHVRRSTTARIHQSSHE